MNRLHVLCKRVRFVHILSIVMLATVIVVSSHIQEAESGWGIKDLDPTNKNSGLNKSLKKFDEQRINETSAYKFYLHNKCSTALDVTFEYIPRGSSKWKKVYYDFRPGERAFLDYTRNRYVYVSAKSKNGKYTWKRDEINMGTAFLEYTYNLTCR